MHARIASHRKLVNAAMLSAMQCNLKKQAELKQVIKKILFSHSEEFQCMYTVAG